MTDKNEKGEKHFGVPVEDFIKDGKQANAKAQLNAALRLFNDAVTKAKAEGVVGMFTFDWDSNIPVKFEEGKSSNGSE